MKCKTEGCIDMANGCGYCDERCARSHACSIPAHVRQRLSEKYRLGKKKTRSPWRFSVPELELDLTLATSSSLFEEKTELERLLTLRRADKKKEKEKIDQTEKEQKDETEKGKGAKEKKDEMKEKNVSSCASEEQEEKAKGAKKRRRDEGKECW